MYASVFPFAYFFGLVYSEGLFLLALLVAVYGLRTERWLAGAIGGAVMTATRVTGVMAVPGLALVGWQVAAGDRRRLIGAALTVTAGLVGIGSYSRTTTWSAARRSRGITRSRTGATNPGVILSAAWCSFCRRWSRGRTVPDDGTDGAVRHAQRLDGSRRAPARADDLAPLQRRIRAHRARRPAAATLSGQFEGLGRYCSVQFPIALALASIEGELRHHVLLTASAIFYALGLAMFVTVHPIL